MGLGLVKKEQRLFELRCILEHASCASSAKVSVDRSLSKIPPPREKQLWMFSVNGQAWICLDWHLIFESKYEVMDNLWSAFSLILLSCIWQMLLYKCIYQSYQFLLSLGIEYLTLALACSTILATGTNSYTLSPYSTLFSCILWSPIFYSFSVSIFLLHIFLLFLILLCLVVLLRSTSMSFISSMAPFVRSRQRPQTSG